MPGVPPPYHQATNLSSVLGGVHATPHTPRNNVEETACHCKLFFDSTSIGVNMHGRKAVQAKSLNYHQATHLSSVLGVYRGPPHTPQTMLKRHHATARLFLTAPPLASTLNLGGLGASRLVCAEQNLSLLPGCTKQGKGAMVMAMAVVMAMAMVMADRLS